MVAYSREYIKRWNPDAVYLTDDNALKYLVLPCLEPNEFGPNPTYHECSKTQYVAGGINANVKRVYRNRCLNYDTNGECAGGNFFIEEGAAVSDACDKCELGVEPECADCKDLYLKPRPVNLTIHLEAISVQTVFDTAHHIKPTVKKLKVVNDNTFTTQTFMGMCMRQYTLMARDGTTHGITMDESDWIMKETSDEYLEVVKSFQDHPEYMIWSPTPVGLLPQDASERAEFWAKVLKVNKLGERIIPGETNEALVGMMSHPDSMGRVCATYVDLIVRGRATAANLPMLDTPITKLSVNVDRAKQLKDYGIMPIPPAVLSGAEKVFDLCAAGTYKLEGKCAPCPSGTFKSEYGDSLTSCIPCISLNGFQMGSPPGSTRF
jgi:hypothetical protein